MESKVKRPDVREENEQDHVVMKRTPKSEIKKGEFMVRIQFHGKRSRFYFKTKEEASSFYEFKRKEIEEKSSNYKKGDVEYYTLGNIFRDTYNWKLDNGKIKESTFVYNHGIFNVHLRKYENLYTHQVTEEIWQKIVQNCLHRKCPSQLEKVLGILNNIQRYLIKKDLTPLDLELDDIEATYKNREKPKNSYDMKEYEKIYSLLAEKEKISSLAWLGANILIIGINTGLRIGELQSLIYEQDIDLENRIISVTKTFSNITKKITTPKTRASVRTVTFNEDAEEAMLNLISYAKDNGSPFLINGQTRRKFRVDRPLTYTAVCTYIKSAQKAAGITPLCSQAAMRKTHITNLIRNAEAEGVPFIEAVTVAQKRAGHSKLTTTLDDYTKTNTEKESKLLNSMSRSKRKKNFEDLDHLTREELLKILKETKS